MRLFGMLFLLRVYCWEQATLGGATVPNTEVSFTNLFNKANFDIPALNARLEW